MDYNFWNDSERTLLTSLTSTWLTMLMMVFIRFLDAHCLCFTHSLHPKLVSSMIRVKRNLTVLFRKCLLLCRHYRVESRMRNAIESNKRRWKKPDFWMTSNIKANDEHYCNTFVRQNSTPVGNVMGSRSRSVLESYLPDMGSLSAWMSTHRFATNFTYVKWLNSHLLLCDF